MKRYTILFVILIVAIVGALALTHKKTPEPKEQKSALDHLKKAVSRKCESNPQPIFTHYPTDIELVTLIEPPFMQVAGDLKGHSYINVTDKAPVYAPADAILTDGVKYQESLGGRGGIDQYLLHFEVSCEVFYFYDHIIDPPEKIAQEFPGPAKDTTKTKFTRRVEVKAGELIGYSVGQNEHNFDFGVVNRSQRSPLKEEGLPFFSDKYVHADCPYDYFEPDKKERLFEVIGYGDASDLVVIENLCD